MTPTENEREMLPNGEIIERVEFIPPDATISSVLRSLLKECDLDDVAYVLEEIRAERQAVSASNHTGVTQ